MKQPNRTRKYKTLYYVLMLLGIILMCTISATFESNKIMDIKIKSKIDSGDYHKKSLFITDKNKKQDMSGYVYYFFTGYSSGNNSTEYILYLDDIEIIADATTYESVKLGHFSHHCIEYNLGKDNETEHIGINKYTLNTLDFT